MSEWTSCDYWAEACKYDVGSKERIVLAKEGDRLDLLEQADELSLVVWEEELLAKLLAKGKDDASRIIR